MSLFCSRVDIPVSLLADSSSLTQPCTYCSVLSRSATQGRLILIKCNIPDSRHVRMFPED